MATMIPEISITEFKKLKAHELKRMKSCEVTSDGQYLFTFINPQSDYIKLQAEATGHLSNIGGGKDPSELLMVEV
uniref:Uncharacterized protein n=2 Tax=viral metagenome TaxID=1070528 RepID=A0A6M3KY63_9ZZZZ